MSAAFFGKRILIVDDHHDYAELLSCVLEREGAKLVVVHDGSSALAQNPADFDLIIMDIRLPGELNGLEVTQHFRSRCQKTPIVALSAQALIEDASAAQAAGCVAYMSKPVALSSLKNTLSKFL